jgi:hypothetical protein
VPRRRGIGAGFVPRIVRGLPNNSFPNTASIHVNGTVLLFAVGVSLSTGLICGIWPALRSSRADIANEMQAQSIRTSGARSSRRLQTLLIAAQAALTVVLLAGAGASRRTFLQLYETRLGYDRGNLVSVALQFPDGTHLELQERQRFYADVRERVSRIPGVKSAAFYPFGYPPHAQSSDAWSYSFNQRACFTSPPIQWPRVLSNAATPILEGTVWSEEETEHAAHAAVVNEAFVHLYWPEGDAVGRRLRLPDFIAFTSWCWPIPEATIGFRFSEWWGTHPTTGSRNLPFRRYILGDSFHLAVRTTGNRLLLAHAIGEAVHSADAGQPVNEMRTAEKILADEVSSHPDLVARRTLVIRLPSAAKPSMSWLPRDSDVV